MEGFERTVFPPHSANVEPGPTAVALGIKDNRVQMELAKLWYANTRKNGDFSRNGIMVAWEKEKMAENYRVYADNNASCTVDIRDEEALHNLLVQLQTNTIQ